jgi:hypothetical protein
MLIGILRRTPDIRPIEYKPLGAGYRICGNCPSIGCLQFRDVVVSVISHPDMCPVKGYSLGASAHGNIDTCLVSFVPALQCNQLLLHVEADVR